MTVPTSIEEHRKRETEINADVLKRGLLKGYLALGKQERMLFIFESYISIVGESLVCLDIVSLIKDRVLISTTE